jgi:hypothetical protein
MKFSVYRLYGRTVDECWIGKYLGGRGRGLFKVLSQQFPGETEEYHKKLKIPGVPAQFQIERLPNTNLGSYH